MKIEFIGDFNELNSMGYQFQKLYANDRDCYHRDDLWVWEEAKSVEITDLYGNSYKVLEYLIANDFVINNPFNLIMFNRKTTEIEEYVKEKHSDARFSGQQLEEYYATYKKVFLEDETIRQLKLLLAKDMIKLN